MESPYGRPEACDFIGDVIDAHHRSQREDLLSGNMRCGWSLEMKIYDGLKRAGFLAGHAEPPLHCPWDCSSCHAYDGVCEDEDGNPIE